MKIKSGFLLREIAGAWVVVPVGQRVVDFNGLMSLSESGALLWSKMEQGVDSQEELVSVLTENYIVEAAAAREDIQDFMHQINERGLIEDGNELGTVKCKADDEFL